MMSAYSAVSFGHANPSLVHALTEQAETLAVTSRAFHTARLGSFLEAPQRALREPHAIPRAVEFRMEVKRLAERLDCGLVLLY